MINQYIVRVCIDGYEYERDYKCPPEWRGSGIYDKAVKVSGEADVEVWATNAQDAEILAEEYDYQTVTDVEISSVQAVRVTLVKIMPNRGEDEEGVIEPVNIEW